LAGGVPGTKMYSTAELKIPKHQKRKREKNLARKIRQGW